MVCELTPTNVFRCLIKIDAPGNWVACKLRAEWTF